MALIPGSSWLWSNYDSFYHEYAAKPVDYKDWLAVLTDTAYRIDTVMTQLVGDFHPGTAELARVYPYVSMQSGHDMITKLTEVYDQAAQTVGRALTVDDKIELCDLLNLWYAFESPVTHDLVYTSIPGLVQGRDYIVRNNHVYVLEPAQFRVSFQVLPAVIQDEHVLEQTWGKPTCMGDALLWLDKPRYRETTALLFRIFYNGPRHADFEVGAKALMNDETVEIIDFRRAVLRNSWTQKMWRTKELGPFDFIVMRDFFTPWAYGSERQRTLSQYTDTLRASYTNFITIASAKRDDTVVSKDNVLLHKYWQFKDIPDCVKAVKRSVTDNAFIADGTLTTDMRTITCPNRDFLELICYRGQYLSTDFNLCTDTLYGEYYKTDLYLNTSDYTVICTDVGEMTDTGRQWRGASASSHVFTHHALTTDAGLTTDSIQSDTDNYQVTTLNSAAPPYTDMERFVQGRRNLGPIIRTDSFQFMKPDNKGGYVPCPKEEAKYKRVVVTNTESMTTSI